jgi:hypothetical protein
MTKSPPPPYSETVIAPKSIKNAISLDLLDAARKEWQFLRTIDRDFPQLYEPWIVRNAIRRYEQFWLPMQVSAEPYDDDNFLILNRIFESGQKNISSHVHMYFGLLPNSESVIRLEHVISYEQTCFSAYSDGR